MSVGGVGLDHPVRRSHVAPAARQSVRSSALVYLTRVMGLFGKARPQAVVARLEESVYTTYSSIQAISIAYASRRADLCPAHKDPARVLGNAVAHRRSAVHVIELGDGRVTSKRRPGDSLYGRAVLSEAFHRPASRHRVISGGETRRCPANIKGRRQKLLRRVLCERGASHHLPLNAPRKIVRTVQALQRRVELAGLRHGRAPPYARRTESNPLPSALYIRRRSR